LGGAEASHQGRIKQVRTKSKRFQELLSSPRTEFLLEAHNGVSARIVEEAGFAAIWGSGLTISGALGVRDSNEASWTQVLEVLEFMNDAANVPILLDADTGYGNFNNVRRLVRKLEQRQVAAMCIEDKLFPKTNSFIGERQPLASVDEFVGKIKAAKDTQKDPDFCVVARIEALIAGHPMGEALKRAEAYWMAGADAILVHSKRPTAHEILDFMNEWGDTCPVVIVPTTYHDTPVEVFEDAGIRLVIWANHTMRCSIAAMQRAARQIFERRSVSGIGASLVSVNELMRLQNAEELEAANRRYLPQTQAQGLVTLPNLEAEVLQ
jgi:phosphoenolpyruvate phosphomutase